MERRELMEDLIRREWAMFQQVNEGTGVRASCQDDRRTFAGMRGAQFEAWPLSALESYREDLCAAEAAGRNLLRDKYVYMMLLDAPEGLPPEYAASVPRPTDEVLRLAGELSDAMLRETERLEALYPCVTRQGRPLQNDGGGAVSIETYGLGEYLTYSERTLEALLARRREAEAQGGSFAEDILTSTVRFYGYDSLPEAEEKMRRASVPEVPHA